jgi:hypothetical protein
MLEGKGRAMSHRTPVLSYQARHEVLLRFMPFYQQADPAKKSLLLDQFLVATGYTRKHAIHLLNHPEKSKQAIQRPRLPLYVSEVQQALFLAWKATRYVCVQRLMPFLPEMIPLLERCGHLALTDIATGWTQCTPLRARTSTVVLAALQRARTLFPFPLLGIDTDNGAEFINEEVRAYCEQEHLTFTRGRPKQKNDQCFIEEKNRTVVRQVVGYDRLVGEQAYQQLQELYRALRLSVNCFQPSMKLLSKQQEGPHLRFIYDPAKTPLQRYCQLKGFP